jgi:hypothetical protein
VTVPTMRRTLAVVVVLGALTAVPPGAQAAKLLTRAQALRFANAQARTGRGWSYTVARPQKVRLTRCKNATHVSNKQAFRDWSCWGAAWWFNQPPDEPTLPGETPAPLDSMIRTVEVLVSTSVYAKHSAANIDYPSDNRCRSEAHWPLNPQLANPETGAQEQGSPTQGCAYATQAAAEAALRLAQLQDFGQQGF